MLSGEPTEKLLERLCEERGLLALPPDREAARRLDAETRAEILRRPDAAEAIAAALPNEARGRGPVELHRHRVLCKLAEGLLSSMDPDRALPVLLTRLKSPDPDVAEASGNALLALAKRDSTIYEHLLDPLVASRARRLALRALVDGQSLDDLEACVLRLVPARVDLDLVLLALSFGSRKAVLAIADVILRGDPGDGLLALSVLEDLHRRGSDLGLLLPTVLRAVRERDDAQVSFPLLESIHRVLLTLIDLDVSFALGDGERIFETPGELRRTLERWLDEHDRGRDPGRDRPQLEGVAPFGDRAWQARIGGLTGEIGLHPSHCGTHPARRGAEARRDGPRRLARAHVQSFVAAGLPIYLYTYGTYIDGGDPHELRFAALLPAALDLLETDDSAIATPPSPVSAEWLSSHAQNLARLRPGRYLIAEVELPVTRVEAGSSEPFAGADATPGAEGGRAADAEDAADTDTDDDEEDDEDDDDETVNATDPFQAPHAVSPLFKGTGTSDGWSAEIAFLPAREPAERPRGGERFSIAYAWFRPAWEANDRYGTPIQPGPIRLYGVVLHGEHAIAEAADQGTLARVLLICPVLCLSDDTILTRAFELFHAAYVVH